MNKDKIIKFRVDIFEQKVIQQKAESSGISVSEYARICTLRRQLPRQMDTQELEIYQDLKKFYNNFSAIKNLLKKGDYAQLVEQINLTQDEIKNHLNFIKNGQ